jgi:hypothetical protein
VTLPLARSSADQVAQRSRSDDARRQSGRIAGNAPARRPAQGRSAQLSGSRPDHRSGNAPARTPKWESHPALRWRARSANATSEIGAEGSRDNPGWGVCSTATRRARRTSAAQSSSPTDTRASSAHPHSARTTANPRGGRIDATLPACAARSRAYPRHSPSADTGANPGCVRSSRPSTSPARMPSREQPQNPRARSKTARAQASGNYLRSARMIATTPATAAIATTTGASRFSTDWPA